MNFPVKATPHESCRRAIKRDWHQGRHLGHLEFTPFVDRTKLMATPPVVFYGWIGDPATPPF